MSAGELAALVAALLAGITAYRKARAQRTWSWRSFFKALLGGAAICAVALFSGLLILRSVRTPLVATLALVLIISAGVTVLALVLRPGRRTP